jgi:hypothetical protein
MEDSGGSRFLEAEKEEEEEKRPVRKKFIAVILRCALVRKCFNPHPAPSAGRLRPGCVRRVDCPLPEGRDYRNGMPSLVGRQTGISLKGELSNHKGNFDEIVPHDAVHAGRDAPRNGNASKNSTNQVRYAIISSMPQSTSFYDVLIHKICKKNKRRFRKIRAYKI